MEIKVESGGKEYTINVSPYLIPYVQLLAMSIANVPITAEQAKKSSDGIKNAWEMLKRHITPTPPEDDINTFLDITMKLSREISEIIRKAVSNANFRSNSTANL